MAGKFFVVFNQADDLRDYAEAIHARMDTLYMTEFQRSFGNFKCGVVHREGPFQTEVVEILPMQHIPLHSHPNVDSIDIFLHGSLHLTVGEVTFKKQVRRGNVRIGKGIVHEGFIGENGLQFLSCQKWSREDHRPYIALDWQGAPCTKHHERLIATLSGVR